MCNKTVSQKLIVKYSKKQKTKLVLILHKPTQMLKIYIITRRYWMLTVAKNPLKD